MLKTGTTQVVRYTKGNGETTERTIIPTYLPQPRYQNVKALDVTDLDSEEREVLETAVREYNEYLEAQRQTLFTFEEFVDHTRQTTVRPKWRTFKPDQLEEQ